jgi:quinohemoprotein ethanol dehydrogenase
MIPDLRYMSPETQRQFKRIVLYGARADRGMAPFADVLSEQDAEAIQAYIFDRTRALTASAGKPQEAHHATD